MAGIWKAAGTGCTWDVQGAGLAPCSIERMSPGLVVLCRWGSKRGMLRQSGIQEGGPSWGRSYCIFPKTSSPHAGGRTQQEWAGDGLSDHTGFFSRQRNQSKKERHLRALTGQVWPQHHRSWFARPRGRSEWELGEWLLSPPTPMPLSQPVLGKLAASWTGSVLLGNLVPSLKWERLRLPSPHSWIVGRPHCGEVAVNRMGQGGFAVVIMEKHTITSEYSYENKLGFAYSQL